MENTEWTQEEMDELYLEMQQKAMTDEEFRKELLADANKALGKLAKKPLPEGMKLKIIENDPAYTATLVLADMVDEELDLEDMKKAAGGANLGFVLQVCAAAVGVNFGPCVGDVCGAKGGFAVGVKKGKSSPCGGHVRFDSCAAKACAVRG